MKFSQALPNTEIKGDEKGLEFLANGLCGQPRCGCRAGSMVLPTNWQHLIRKFKWQFHNVIIKLSAFFPLTGSCPLKKYKSDKNFPEKKYW